MTLKQQVIGYCKDGHVTAAELLRAFPGVKRTTLMSYRGDARDARMLRDGVDSGGRGPSDAEKYQIEMRTARIRAVKIIRGEVPVNPGWTVPRWSGFGAPRELMAITEEETRCPI